MAATAAPSHSPEPHGTRRDFLEMVAWATAAVGVGAVVWPLIDQMNPSADVLALSSTEVDLTHIAEGMGITAVWRGKPVFVRHRTAQEIDEARKVNVSELRDPQPDSARVKPGHAPWLIVYGNCTHLGCVPLGQQGEYGGWFCPCHGSVYDTSGRIRQGPAPLNLAVPDYAYTSDTTVKIG